jgi:glycosyltransferase involved in cell wall biosynthesis
MDRDAPIQTIRTMNRPVRTAFVMEQALGHVTHYKNLRAVAAEHASVSPTWLPVPFAVRGPARLLPLWGSNWSLRASWRARRALITTLARQPLDALLFHTQVTALFSVDLMRKLPAIVSLDATPINYDSVGGPYGHAPAGDGPIDVQKFRLNRRAFHAAARLVSWSEWARRSLVDDYGVDSSNITVLAPGAAPAFFRLGEQRSQRPPARSDVPVRVLFVGGDFERKGGRVLLDCLRGPLADGCELDVVSGGATIEAAPGVRVHANLGPNSPELLRLFAEADLFVLPTLADCLPVVLMEATAAGLAVVTTTVGAVGETVQHGQSGFAVPPGNPQALHDALSTAIGDAALRQRMGRAGHALARQKFNAKCNNMALLDLLTEVADRVTDPSRSAA